MTETAARTPADTAGPEHVDVLILGAGISGLGAAYHLSDQRPGTTFVLLETLDHIGGTWWTQKYPGVRSDSDLFTLGYRFKAWGGDPIATGEQILTYLGEVVEENDLARHIRFRHRVEHASWSSEDNRWTVTARNLDTDELVAFTCSFLWMCHGYYRHWQPHRPEWEGLEDFQGTVVHTQEWPEDLDVTGKRVIVIGSGATAATLIPAIADDAAHVTMLQRSPTYYMARQNKNELADTLRELDIPPEWTHEIVRRQMFKLFEQMRQASAFNPEMAKTFLIDEVRKQLPEDFDVEKHFTPAYRVWQQRLAILPGGDLFTKISEGKVSVVTDTIGRFTETGIKTGSGEHLEADIIVTATGFELSVLGDVDFEVDGSEIDPADLVTYRGIMFTGLPNLAYVFGYFRASWTLRADIISDFVCRLLAHMEATGTHKVVPTLRPEDADMERRPWVEPDNFNPGYLMRSMHLLPKQGSHDPWTWGLEYGAEKQALADADLEDGTLRFT
ncbi:MAG TPA: NAD(P)/FAD-dependent oxidoreductase [Acidimicrobiia bacterium]|nr:NAD(P)/FAD-dependent oxidoreductase [Acidimicrobiia bacterium]